MTLEWEIQKARNSIWKNLCFLKHLQVLDKLSSRGQDSAGEKSGAHQPETWDWSHSCWKSVHLHWVSVTSPAEAGGWVGETFLHLACFFFHSIILLHPYYLPDSVIGAAIKHGRQCNFSGDIVSNSASATNKHPLALFCPHLSLSSDVTQKPSKATLAKVGSPSPSHCIACHPDLFHVEHLALPETIFFYII
uniref:Uncharacterized protein n=1 Tax=Myotis myotis TaxID=51298 RepID=A0A7J7TJ99_MYOMY|nr:hypothetical protein mMyoMyo1_009068 [Myotis myotis]